MLHRTLQFILVAIGGPLLAFVLVFAGCEGASPVLGTMCGHNILGSLVAFTLGAWLVLGICVSLYNGLRAKE
jgi:hypothetical protein